MNQPEQMKLDLRRETTLRPRLFCGTVLRHRLATDDDGRFLEFSIVSAVESIRCRFSLAGRLGDQPAHGHRFAVGGQIIELAGQQVLDVRFFVAIGHIPVDSVQLCRGIRLQRRRRHVAISRATHRGVASDR